MQSYNSVPNSKFFLSIDKLLKKCYLMSQLGTGKSLSTALYSKTNPEFFFQ